NYRGIFFPDVVTGRRANFALALFVDSDTSLSVLAGNGLAFSLRSFRIRLLMRTLWLGAAFDAYRGSFYWENFPLNEAVNSLHDIGDEVQDKHDKNDHRRHGEGDEAIGDAIVGVGFLIFG